MEPIKWEAPPPKKSRRVEEVAAQLLAKPGEWALIHTTTGLELMPWYLPICKDVDRFEVESHKVNPQDGLLFSSPRKIYARARVKNED